MVEIVHLPPPMHDKSQLELLVGWHPARSCCVVGKDVLWASEEDHENNQITCCRKRGQTRAVQRDFVMAMHAQTKSEESKQQCLLQSQNAAKNAFRGP
jgi:hypothetical protein